MSVLVTGAAGYIGSHAAQRLLRDGHEVVALDNLSRGHRGALERLEAGAGRLHVVEADTSDRARVLGALREHGVDTVLHFAAYALVGESVERPLLYYRNNSAASAQLLSACDEAGVARFVFSSTCATYGEPGAEHIPIAETCPQAPINPYGRSKLHTERMLADYAAACRLAGRPFAYAALRYFNVAGCDRAGRLGEDHDPETHLIPVILQTYLGKRERVTIFGTDYPTPDGTCIRDYVHVEDLVDAHVVVMDALRPGDERVYNLGIGEGLSVRQIIEAAEVVVGRPLPVVEGERRAGDPPVLDADPSRSRTELGGRASVTDVRPIIESAWRWFEANPDGYGG